MTTIAVSSRLVLVSIVVFGLAGCASSAGRVSPSPSAGSGSPSPAGSVVAPGASASPAGPSASMPLPAAESATPTESQALDIGGGTTAGDVPDNAVFLTYRQAALGFSIQYVEGWQVTTEPDGVVIHDKDSSETITIASSPPDVAAYVKSTDLPALQAQAGYRFVKQDTVKVGAATLQKVVYHILSPVDPVTGKRVPSTVDRYYVPGPTRLAIVSLSTPDGVDNVDAFRQMIESFAWS